ncbi:hypothetical protein AAG570_013801 [Ranatra chinensis]|uniref:Uncharacterized protein n=1 Tax=Ranatra chinensis TaxID=642074 RepID=A0ABD0YDE8_9HEMI
MHSLDAGPDGALVLQFSHSGLLLACPTRTAIVLYTFQGQIYLVLSGHTGLVYCVQWSKDDKYLISASADSTVCVWNIEARHPSPEQVLSHPSYVYSCCWLGGQGRRLATGCFDGTLRLWRPSDPKEPEQLLSHHKSRVNCVIAIDPRLVSADAEGVIVIWAERENGSFGLERELKVNELSGKVINKLCPHPNGKRILVQTRDSLLRMLDVKTGAVIQWYQGGVNRKLRMDSGFCGCGSKVLGTSEDGTLCAWQSDTGAQVAIYQLATLAAPPPSAVAFHPRDHVLAVVSHANDFYPSLVVMGYDRYVVIQLTLRIY